MKKIKVYLLIGLAMIIGVLVLNSAVASTADDKQLKMALTYNFARYTEWPDTLTSETLNFCIFENENLAKVFNKLVGKTIEGRKIIVSNVSLKYTDEKEITSCQLLFIDSRERNKISIILALITGKPILTVGQIPDFIDSGGIINLYWEDDKLRFEISPTAALRASLKISSRLLQVAKVVNN